MIQWANISNALNIIIGSVAALCRVRSVVYLIDGRVSPVERVCRENGDVSESSGVGKLEGGHQKEEIEVDRLGVGPPGEVFHEELQNELAHCPCAELFVLFLEPGFPQLNGLFENLIASGFEGEAVGRQDKENHPDGPDVASVIVAPVEHLGGHVVDRPGEGS